jgi:hypothetical protein
MDAYVFGKIAAFQKLGLGIGDALRAGAKAADISALKAVYAKMAPEELEALKAYITKVGPGGVPRTDIADLWHTNPELAQKIHDAVHAIPTPTSRAGFRRGGPRPDANWTPSERAERRRAEYDARYRDLWPTMLNVGILASAPPMLFHKPVTRLGYGGEPAPWKKNRVYGVGLLSNVLGGLAGAGLGTALSVLLRRAPLALPIGGAIGGALGSNYLGGVAQR